MAPAGRLMELLRCTHLAPSLAVTAVAVTLSLGAGRGWWTLLVGAAVLSGQFSVGWANDWLDARRDLAVGRLDKPVVRGTVRPGTLRAAAFGALAVCALLSLAGGLAAGLTHLAAVACAWGYDLGLKSTPASVLAFGAAFGLLPMFCTLAGAGGRPAPAWMVTAGALLGAGAHFTNALPDLAEDARTGVRGLPQRLGPGASALAATGLLAAAACTVGVGGGASGGAGVGVALATAGAAIAAVPLVALRGRLRLAFPLAMLAALAVVAAFVLAGLGA